MKYSGPRVSAYIRNGAEVVLGGQPITRFENLILFSGTDDISHSLLNSDFFIQQECYFRQAPAPHRLHCHIRYPLQSSCDPHRVSLRLFLPSPQR